MSQHDIVRLVEVLSSCVYLLSCDDDIILDPPHVRRRVADSDADNVHRVAHRGLDAGWRQLREHGSKIIICNTSSAQIYNNIFYTWYNIIL